MRKEVVLGICLLLLVAFSVFAYAQTCPKDFTYKGVKQKNVVFSHSKHTAKNPKCTDCHTKIFKMKMSGSGMTMDAMNKGQYCGTCHNGTKAFAVKECAKCHK